MKKERSLIFTEVWRDGLDFEKVVDLICKSKDTDIIVDCAKESHLYSNFTSHDVEELVEITKVKIKNNNTVHVIIGSYSTYPIDYAISDLKMGIDDMTHVPQFCKAMIAGIIDQVHCWPTYFLSWNGIKILDRFIDSNPQPDTEKEKLFFLPIRVAKPERMLLLDELEKRDLLNHEISAFTCLDPNDTWEDSLHSVGGTHYTAGKQILRPGGDDVGDIYANPPIVIKKCLINVVSETSYDSHFFTEKTVWPLLYQMPFIIQGACGINKKLTTLGFELFDEFIDYSFDDIDRPRERTVAIANELERLAKLNLDYSQVYANVKDKLEHNLCRLIDLYHNDEYMPGIVRNASDKLVEATLNPNIDQLIDPIMGSWHAYVDSNGRNQKAVDIIRDTPYFLELYRNWL